MQISLRCINYKKHDDIVRQLKSQKKILDVQSLYLYELGLFKFNNNLLPVKKYYISIKNVHNYHTRSSETI